MTPCTTQRELHLGAKAPLGSLLKPDLNDIAGAILNTDPIVKELHERIREFHLAAMTCRKLRADVEALVEALHERCMSYPAVSLVSPQEIGDGR